jgi:hypothetical protein
MIEKIDFVARESSGVVRRQQDAIAKRIAAVLQERKKVGAERRERDSEYQRLNGERALARYYKLREGYPAAHCDKEQSELRQHRNQRMKPIDSAHNKIISSDAAFARLDIAGDDKPALLCYLEISPKKGAFMSESRLAESEYKEEKQLAAGLSRSLCHLVEMQASQIAALQLGDARTQQFEEEISAALQTWQRARKLYVTYVQEHACC